MLDEVPVVGRERYARAALLEVRRRAVVIGVPVRDQHVLHVIRVQLERAQPRQQHGLELVGITRVDEHEAGARGHGVDHGARAPECVDVVEQARRRQHGIVSAVGAPGVAAEEFDRVGPLGAGGRMRPRHRRR